MTAKPGLEPGSLYRETILTMRQDDKAWRVMDPRTFFPESARWLPNPVHTISAVSLEGATRAEVTIDFWSGHDGTTDKKIRFNDWRPWLPLPEALAGAYGPARDYHAQYNLTLAVPLNHLIEGDNKVRGACGDNPWGWGQWGWDSLVLRVFLDPSTIDSAWPKVRASSRPEGSFAFTLENPSHLDIHQVDYFARYQGLDEDGDGIQLDYHGMFQGGTWTGHLGSSPNPTQPLLWDTTWIPDQSQPITVLARCRLADGRWLVTQTLEGLVLPPRGYAIQLVSATQVPPKFGVRAGQTKSCILPLPKDFRREDFLEARLFLRTWNARNNETQHSPYRINGSAWRTDLTGPAHAFAMGQIPLPRDLLHEGHNLITLTSATQHHGPEILWPGPQLLLKSHHRNKSNTSDKP